MEPIFRHHDPDKDEPPGLTERPHYVLRKPRFPRDEEHVRVLLEKHPVFAVNRILRSWSGIALKRIEEPAILVAFN